jgi:hypothetical protein
MLSTIKGNYEKHVANIILHDKMLEAVSLE